VLPTNGRAADCVCSKAVTVDAAWKNQASIDAHVRFFFVTLLVSGGWSVWVAKRGLAALAGVLVLMLGLYTLDTVLKRAAAVSAARRADATFTLAYPPSSDAARRLIISANTLLIAAIIWLSLSEVLDTVAGPWPPVVAAVIAAQLAAGAWFVQGRVAKRHELAQPSGAGAGFSSGAASGAGSAGLGASTGFGASTAGAGAGGSTAFGGSTAAGTGSTAAGGGATGAATGAGAGAGAATGAGS